MRQTIKRLSGKDTSMQTEKEQCTWDSISRDMIKIGRFSWKDCEAFSVRSLQKLGSIVSYISSVDYINLTFIWKWMKGLVLKKLWYRVSGVVNIKILVSKKKKSHKYLEKITLKADVSSLSPSSIIKGKVDTRKFVIFLWK